MSGESKRRRLLCFGASLSIVGYTFTYKVLGYYFYHNNGDSHGKEEHVMNTGVLGIRISRD